MSCKVLGQDEVISALTQRYVTILAPALVAFSIYTSTAKYLQSQSIAIPSMVIGIIANIINALCHYVLLHYQNLDLTGSAISQCAAYTFMAVCNSVYVIYINKHTVGWSGFSTDCFK